MGLPSATFLANGAGGFAGAACGGGSDSGGCGGSGSGGSGSSSGGGGGGILAGGTTEGGTVPEGAGSWVAVFSPELTATVTEPGLMLAANPLAGGGASAVGALTVVGG